MVQQGRILAAALSERGPLQARDAEALLARLRQQSEARLRIVDPDGRILADSSRLGPAARGRTTRRGSRRRPACATIRCTGPARGSTGQPSGSAARRRRPSPRSVEPPARPTSCGTPEVRAALAGRYGARTRASPGGRRSMTLFSALPVWDGGRWSARWRSRSRRPGSSAPSTRRGSASSRCSWPRSRSPPSSACSSRPRSSGRSGGSGTSRARSSTGAGVSAAASAAPGGGTRSASWRAPSRS